MGKRSKRRKNKSKNKGTVKTAASPPRKPPSIVKPTISNEPPKKNWWQKISLGWRIFGAICLILGFLAALKPVRELFMSKHATYEEENVVSGTLEAPKVSSPDSLNYSELDTTPIFSHVIKDTFPSVNGIRIKDSASDLIEILIGHMTWMIDKGELKRGIKIFSPKTSDACYQTTLRLILRNHRIYVYAEFRDFKNDHLVGVMDYNHWKIYLKNLLDYRKKDDRLEVLDQQGYVIFSILFSDKGQSPNGAVALSGYFMNPKSILIVNTKAMPVIHLPTDSPLDELSCIEKDSATYWQQVAEESIRKIKSVYDYN